MSVTRPEVKTRLLKKIQIQTSLVINSPLESGQLERWYFHLDARKGILVFSPTHFHPPVFTHHFLTHLFWPTFSLPQSISCNGCSTSSPASSPVTVFYTFVHVMEPCFNTVTQAEETVSRIHPAWLWVRTVNRWNISQVYCLCISVESSTAFVFEFGIFLWVTRKNLQTRMVLQRVGEIWSDWNQREGEKRWLEKGGGKRWVKLVGENAWVKNR